MRDFLNGLKTLHNISLKELILSNRYYLIFGFFLLIIGKIASLVIPSAAKYIIDDVIGNNDFDLLRKIVFIVSAALIVQVLSSFLLFHLLGIRAQQKIAEARTLFFNKLTLLPLTYFKGSSSGELTSRVLSDFESIRIFLGSGLVYFAGGVVSVIAALIFMFMLNLWLTVYIIVPILSCSILLYFIYKKQRSFFKQKQVIRAVSSANLTEAFRGIKIIKGFASNNYASSIVSETFYALFYAIKRTLIGVNLMLSSSILFMGATSLFLMVLGSIMVINGELTVGELTTFTMYLGFLIAPILQITRVSNQFSDARASIERINEVLYLENEEQNLEQPEMVLKGTIEFQNVSFSYNASQTILNDISFAIEPNTVTAIIGKSGSGKSTLTDLIASFYLPNSGEIKVDGNALGTVNLHAYRQQLGFVFQETYLFNTTIRDNVLLSNPTASDEALQEALTKANVNEFIANLPEGINTQIGEDGALLSSGQKQRIAIARAFLSNPKILILDEATANLDAYNEKLIQESIAKLMNDRTVIVIAHRLNTIKKADQIILLDAGKILEVGTHEELINKQGSYLSLYNSYTD